MPLRDDMQLISVDDHVIEHADVWQDRLAKRYREAGPRVVEIDTSFTDPTYAGTAAAGSQVWRFEDRLFPTPLMSAAAGIDSKDLHMGALRFDAIRAGCYDPLERVKDMDLDGIRAQLCFPTMPGTCGGVFYRASDKELALACIEAYNDFMLDEWSAAAPGRYIPMVMIPLWDTGLAATEIQRTAAKGAKAITFTENPVPLGLPSFHTEHWDPVFAAAQDADLTLCIHFGSSSKMPDVAPDAPITVLFSVFGMNSFYAMADLLFAPTFHKFDRLRFALSEGSIGWMPFLLEKVDRTWETHRQHSGGQMDARPSDLFRDHIFGCFIDEIHGLESRYKIGVENIMWECDYPHPDSNWPHARKKLAEVTEGIPDDELRRIVELNAREVFRFYD